MDLRGNAPLQSACKADLQPSEQAHWLQKKGLSLRFPPKAVGVLLLDHSEINYENKRTQLFTRSTLKLQPYWQGRRELHTEPRRWKR